MLWSRADSVHGLLSTFSSDAAEAGPLVALTSMEDANSSMEEAAISQLLNTFSVGGTLLLSMSHVERKILEYSPINLNTVQ